jgi:ribosome-interacting GTPase 1
MTIKIGKNSGKEIVKILEEKLKRTGKSGNLEKHFGKLKRNLDGLDYQNEMRENES